MTFKLLTKIVAFDGVFIRRNLYVVDDDCQPNSISLQLLPEPYSKIKNNLQNILITYVFTIRVTIYSRKRHVLCADFEATDSPITINLEDKAAFI